MTLERQPEQPDVPSGMTLDVKVLGAVAILVMLLVIAIALAVAFILLLGTGANVAERQARYTTAIDSAALNAKTLANDERGFLISGRQEFLAQLDSGVAPVRTAFDAAAEAASAEQRATVAEAREGFERWVDLVFEEIAIYQAGDEEAAIEMSLGPVRISRHSYEGWLADAKSLGVDAFQDATASVADASSRSVMILLVYLVAAVGVAVAIALWVVRTVLRPAYALVRLLADGDEGPKRGVAG